MKTYTIGRNPDANILLTANFCSRDHAKLTIADSGKILLQDMSSNGTMVNGKKVSNQTVELRYGDEVLFAGVEKLDWSKIEKPEERPVSVPGKPNPIMPFIRKNGFMILGLVLLVSGGLWLYNMDFGTKAVKEEPLAASDIYARYQNAVAMVEVTYYVRVATVAGDLYFGTKEGGIDSDRDKNNLEPFKSEGTAFFIDSNGTLITNRHVVEPWNSKELSRHFYSKVIPAIKLVLKQKGWGNDEPKPYPVPVATSIYPNGKRHSPENRVECSVVKVAPDEAIDLASLQTKDGQLPDGVTVVSAVENHGNNIDVATPAYVIGYPGGDELSVNENNEVNSIYTQGTFTQAPSVSYVQFSAPTAGGGSGSPVFNQYGKLVAVTYQGSKDGGSFNRGILAKYIHTVR